MLHYIPEFLGAMVMILLLDGAVANCTLNKSGMKGAGSLQISLSIGLSLLVPCCIFGTDSGTYYNSALTLALFIDGTLPFDQALNCIIAQFAGAFVGAVLVYICFKDQFDATEDPGTKLGVFCTGPSIPNAPRNFFCEAVAAFIFVLTVKGIGSTAQPDTHKFLVPAVYAALTLCMGGLTGCAMNPARDFAPRFAHAFLPIKGKGSSIWGYALVPVLGPVIGAVLAVLLWGII
ncbi:MAG: aquaporin family protein [Oscillospiraceae bacterium]|nr:aquaporin family protein [Oscillospiraceae bacterium]